MVKNFDFKDFADESNLTDEEKKTVSDIKNYVKRAREGKLDTKLKDGDLEILKKKMLRSIEIDTQQLVSTEKFISGLVLRMPVIPVRDCRVSTALTDGTNIYFDIDFYTRLNKNERIFVLAHEVWHNALLHFLRCEDREKEVWNIATDCEINYALHEDGFVMPPGLCYPCRSDEGKCAEDIYDHLIKIMKKKRGGNNDNKSKNNNSTKSSSNEYENGSTGNGYSHTKNDTRRTNGSENFDEQFDHHMSKGSGCDSDENNSCGGFKSPRDKWGEKGFDKDFKPCIGDDVADKIREMVISEAQRYERIKGSVPSCLKRIIESICKPEVPWEELLSQFVTSCLGDKRQWLPPLRRGVYNEMYFQSRRGQKINVTCIVDTSGSTTADLPKFLTELVSLLNTFGRYELTLIHCDCEVHRVDTFDEYNQFPIDNPQEYGFEGGGGSSLVPAFDEIYSRGLEPSCVIVFTDGVIDCPETNPTGVPTLFILTQDGYEDLCDWGKKLRFKPNKNRD